MTISPSSQRPDDFLKLRKLFSALCEETISRDQFQHLEKRLSEDVQARAYFARYMQLHVFMEHIFATVPPSKENPDLVAVPKETSSPNEVLPSSLSGILANAYQGTIGFFSQEMPFALLIATVITGLGLLAGSLIYVTHHRQIAAEVSPSSATAPSNRKVISTDIEFVGRVTGMVGVKWSDINTSTELGNGVPLGRKYDLASGLMEITYNAGAKVILQGPVTYAIDSRDGGFLSLGKLTARLEKRGEGREESRGKVASDQQAVASGQWLVASETNLPSPARGRGAGGEGGQQSAKVASGQWLVASEERLGGRDKRSEPANQKSEIINHKSSDPRPQSPTPVFAVRTPTATVTDLGTEFGVEVRESGITFAHVYCGAVDVRANHANSNGESIRLAADESVEVRSVGAKEAPTVRRATVDPSAFVRTEQFLRLAGEQKFKALRRWQDYMDKLRRDPALVVHYDFQKKDDSSNILHGVTRSSDSRLDGVIDGAVWADGRMPGKNALEFDGLNTRVKVKLPQRLTQITIAAWVTIGRINDSGGTDYHGVASGLLMSEGWGKQGDSSEKCHWQITRAGEIYFGTPDYNVRIPEVLPWQQWGRNRWRHLVVATDPVHRQIACYLDGKQVLATEFSERFAVAFNDATIGSWKTDAGTIERGLCGRMDDLVIFSRAMTTQEIRDMYEAGKP